MLELIDFLYEFVIASEFLNQLEMGLNKYGSDN